MQLSNGSFCLNIPEIHPFSSGPLSLLSRPSIFLSGILTTLNYWNASSLFPPSMSSILVWVQKHQKNIGFCGHRPHNPHRHTHFLLNDSHPSSLAQPQEGSSVAGMSLLPQSGVLPFLFLTSSHAHSRSPHTALCALPSGQVSFPTVFS